MQPLDAPVGDEDGDGSLTLSEVLPKTAALEPSMSSPGSTDPVSGVTWASFWLRCAPHRAEWRSPSAISASRRPLGALGLNRSTIYERLAAIRETAANLGLDGYFEAVPTVWADRR